MKIFKKEFRWALGLAIRQQRQRRQWTQADLARISGVKLNQVSCIERAIQNPSLETVRCLAAALGIPMSKLFRIMETLAATTDYVQTWTRRQRRAPGAARR